MDLTINYSDLRVGKYSRKSTEDDDRQVLSLESQDTECDRTAKFYKISNLVDTYSESMSAKIAGRRKEFSRLVIDIDSGKINAILCWHINRIARNMTEGGIIIDYLSTGKLKAIITPHEVFTPNTDSSILSFHFGSSKQYSKNLAKDVKRGQRTKATHGLGPGVAPLGFLNSKQGDKGSRWWYVDEDRFWKIKKLLELYLTGNYSVGKLTKYAREELKLTTVARKRIGGKLVVISNVYYILKNPIYAGFFFVQDERYSLDKKHPRMITESQYKQILQMLSYKFRPKVQKHDSAFSGYIYSTENDLLGQDVKFQLVCDCGYKFAYRSVDKCMKCKKRIAQMDNPKYYKRVYFYNNRKKKAQLDYKSLPEEILLKKVLGFGEANLSLPKHLLEWSKKHIKELADTEVNDNLNIMLDKEKRTKDFENKKSRLRAMLRDQHITDEEYKSDLTNLEQEYSDTKIQSETLDWMKELNEIVNLSECFVDVLKSGDAEAKRNILSKLGSNFIWNDEIVDFSHRKVINTFSKHVNTIKSKYPMFELENPLILQGDSSDLAPIHSDLR